MARTFSSKCTSSTKCTSVKGANCSKCIIKFLKNKKGEKLLPFQFYNLFNFITMPMLNKRPFIKGWNLFKKTVHPTSTLQNIGVLAGKVSNITVLDIDTQDAIKFFDKISKDHGYTCNTPMVSTPTGLHVYYQFVPELKSSIRLKIPGTETKTPFKLNWDLKNNGIVVLPPSTIGVNTYAWIKGKSLSDLSIKKMPRWLIEFIREHQS